MTSMLPTHILLLSIAGVTGLVFLVTRLYILFSAIGLKHFCRKEASESLRNQCAERYFHEGILKEITAAGKHYAAALWFALALMVFLWFFGTLPVSVGRELMNWLQIVTGCSLLVSELIKILSAILVPKGISCGSKLQTAQANVFKPLLVLVVLCAAGQWMYSL